MALSQGVKAPRPSTPPVGPGPRPPLRTSRSSTLATFLPQTRRPLPQPRTGTRVVCSLSRKLLLLLMGLNSWSQSPSLAFNASVTFSERPFHRPFRIECLSFSLRAFSLRSHPRNDPAIGGLICLVRVFPARGKPQQGAAVSVLFRSNSHP